MFTVGEPFFENLVAAELVVPDGGRDTVPVIDVATGDAQPAKLFAAVGIKGGEIGAREWTIFFVGNIIGNP